MEFPFLLLFRIYLGSRTLLMWRMVTKGAVNITQRWIFSAKMLVRCLKGTFYSAPKKKLVMEA